MKLKKITREAKFWQMGCAACLLVLALILTGISTQGGKEWRLTNVSGHLPDLRFSLIADDGQPVTEQNYRGDVVLLYFGFTGCSRECPMMMTRLRHIMQELADDAVHARILFVTVDPANDTPQVLHQYIASFDPEHMAGLTGTEYGIEALAKKYRAAYRPSHKDSNDILHSNVVYVFDRDGHARLLVTPEDSDDKMLHDIRRLIYDRS